VADRDGYVRVPIPTLDEQESLQLFLKTAPYGAVVATATTPVVRSEGCQTAQPPISSWGSQSQTLSPDGKSVIYSLTGVAPALTGQDPAPSGQTTTPLSIVSYTWTREGQPFVGSNNSGNGSVSLPLLEAMEEAPQLTVTVQTAGFLPVSKSYSFFAGLPGDTNTVAPTLAFPYQTSALSQSKLCVGDLLSLNLHGVYPSGTDLSKIQIRAYQLNANGTMGRPVVLTVNGSSVGFTTNLLNPSFDAYSQGAILMDNDRWIETSVPSTLLGLRWRFDVGSYSKVSTANGTVTNFAPLATAITPVVVSGSCGIKRTPVAWEGKRQYRSQAREFYTVGLPKPAMWTARQPQNTTVSYSWTEGGIPVIPGYGDYATTTVTSTEQLQALSQSPKYRAPVLTVTVATKGYLPVSKVYHFKNTKEAKRYLKKLKAAS